MNPAGIQFFWSHVCIANYLAAFQQCKSVSYAPDSRLELLDEPVLLLLVFHPVHTGNDELRHHTALGAGPAHNHSYLTAFETAELTSVRLWTHLRIWFWNCSAQRHCRMQLKQYVWQQLERMPKRRSDGDTFSYTTSRQILHCLS